MSSHETKHIFWQIWLFGRESSPAPKASWQKVHLSYQARWLAFLDTEEMRLNNIRLPADWWLTVSVTDAGQVGNDTGLRAAHTSSKA